MYFKREAAARFSDFSLISRHIMGQCGWWTLDREREEVRENGQWPSGARQLPTELTRARGLSHVNNGSQTRLLALIKLHKDLD